MWLAAPGGDAPWALERYVRFSRHVKTKAIMAIITPLFFVTGALLLIFGFKKNNRAMLTLSAFLWLASGTWNDFSNGFADGVRDTYVAVAPSHPQ
ncbi:hypothetical protein ACLB1G_15865 [Oxalobacteraceae bacterium A2-2]